MFFSFELVSSREGWKKRKERHLTCVVEFLFEYFSGYTPERLNPSGRHKSSWTPGSGSNFPLNRLILLRSLVKWTLSSQEIRASLCLSCFWRHLIFPSSPILSELLWVSVFHAPSHLTCPGIPGWISWTAFWVAPEFQFWSRQTCSEPWWRADWGA